MENLLKLKFQKNLLIVSFLIIFLGIFFFWLSSVFVVPTDLVFQTSQEETPVGELIPPSLKRVKDYPTELETKTLKEIIELSKGKGESAQKARNLKKLVEQQKRLTEKF
jgi:hypothetical protein